jgi:O-glycosyl hydrolase
MFAKRKFFIKSAVFAAALVFAFVLTTCEDLGYKAQEAIVDAQSPRITAQPQGGSYTLGTGAAPTVTVTAVSEDGGTLSYQWYQADDEQYDADSGTAFQGATEDTFTFTSTLGDGVFQVYVIVTNTNTSVNGDQTAQDKSYLVRVVINDPSNAQYPNITAEPASTAYDWADGLEVDGISVTAAVSDGGVLTYQWYKANTYTTSTTAQGTTLIQDETTNSYQPEIDATGTYYYFVAVTNTNNSAVGRKTSVTYSSPAVIKAVTANATITVSSAKAQYVRGFGVMALFWGNSPQDSVRDYERMFNPNNLGYNMLRIMIPVYGPNIRTTMQKALNNELSGERDRRHYYDIVKLVNGYNGYVLASPWSPPPQWKSNKSINGGAAGADAKLLKDYWWDYADYLEEYCTIMNENGAPIYAVSIQNEPNFRASYDGCEWSDAEMRDFIKQVGQFTTGIKGWGGGVETPRVLIMNGESANSPTINDPVLNDATARGFIDLYARHYYGSQQVVRSTEVQALGKEIWMTEYNVNGGNVESYPNDSTYNYMWKFLNTVDGVIRQNKENAFIWWYGKRFYSMIGDGDYGTVNGAIQPRGWALSHYAKYASNTDQVGLTITGTYSGGGAITTGTNFNNTSYNVDSTAVRATAFLAKDGNSLSLVLFTPTNTSGNGGTNMGNVKIDFPAGFIATKVTAMRTRNGSMGKPDGETVLLKGGTGAFINLPAGQILSVKFTK